MTADQDVYRKTGRGGAGNYYAPPKADEASKDLEAQEHAQDFSTAEAPPPDRDSTQVPTRAGRGGAGNYVAPEDLPDADEQARMADRTAAAVNASLKSKSRGGHQYGGRGGAGNWRGDAGNDEAAEANSERARGHELEQKVREAVDKGLKMPEKVLHHHGVAKHDA